MSEEKTTGTESIKLYNLDELEPILEVSYLTLLNYVRSGKLRGVKIGKRWKVSEENLRRFVNGESQND